MPCHSIQENQIRDCLLYTSLLHDLDDFPVPSAFDALAEVAFPTGWALAAAVWRIPVADSLAAYLWSWCENQVMAALKAVPLGQTGGQRVLLALGSRIPAVVQQALTPPEAEWSNFAPGLALASSCLLYTSPCLAAVPARRPAPMPPPARQGRGTFSACSKPPKRFR